MVKRRILFAANAGVTYQDTEQGLRNIRALRIYADSRTNPVHGMILAGLIKDTLTPEEKAAYDLAHGILSQEIGRRHPDITLDDLVLTLDDLVFEGLVNDPMDYQPNEIASAHTIKNTIKEGVRRAGEIYTDLSQLVLPNTLFLCPGSLDVDLDALRSINQDFGLNVNLPAQVNFHNFNAQGFTLPDVAASTVFPLHASEGEDRATGDGVELFLPGYHHLLQESRYGTQVMPNFNRDGRVRLIAGQGHAQRDFLVTTIPISGLFSPEVYDGFTNPEVDDAFNPQIAKLILDSVPFRLEDIERGTEGALLVRPHPRQMVIHGGSLADGFFWDIEMDDDGLTGRPALIHIRYDGNNVAFTEPFPYTTRKAFFGYRGTPPSRREQSGLAEMLTRERENVRRLLGGVGPIAEVSRAQHARAERLRRDATVSYGQQKVFTALQGYKEAAEIDPGNVGLLLEIADLSYALGTDERAQEMYARRAQRLGATVENCPALLEGAKQYAKRALISVNFQEDPSAEQVAMAHGLIAAVFHKQYDIAQRAGDLDQARVHLELAQVHIYNARALYARLDPDGKVAEMIHQAGRVIPQAARALAQQRN